MNLNIDDFGGKSVVPVRCGGYVSGTAFFVSSTKLLTAAHVLAEYILDNDVMVAILVGGEYIRCKVLYYNEIEKDEISPDVAVLECMNYKSSNFLKLLSCKFKEGIEANVIGYPIELGNGVDCFGVKVKNIRELPNCNRGFDCMVVRTDNLDFHSYAGFSGAPVINNFGKVIGIETDQLYNTLGYLSVKAFKQSIEQYIKDAEIEENDDIYDDRPYGLWTSRNHILNHTKDMLKTRYNSKVHVENKYAETFIQSFCGYGLDNEQKDIRDLFEIWYKKLAGTRRQVVGSNQLITQYINDGLIKEDMMYEIVKMLSEKSAEKKLHLLDHEELSSIYYRMSEWNSNRKKYENNQFLYVSGTAGCGKSHLLYYLSEKMSASHNIYMFLGSEFSPLEDPIRTIARIMNWKDSDWLEALNNEMQNKKRKATIIIDALNEGAGTHFWIDKLPILKEKIKKYPKLKLIVSLRKISQEDQLNVILKGEWGNLELEGFADREKAIEKYFNVYDISDDVNYYKDIKEFCNPLFLKMFCDAYYGLSENERTKVLRIPIYEKFLKKCNDEVSHGIDEDPKQNIASKYIKWVALCSMEQYQCEDIPRQIAYQQSREMCPLRIWSKSLLKNCLDANLLREYTTNEGDFVDFEFDSMGDFLKAESLLNSKYHESERLRIILRLNDVMNENYKSRSGENWQKQYNFIIAFLSLWNPPAKIWQESCFIKGQLTSMLLSCLPYRNVRDSENTLTSEIIKNILEQNPNYIDPQLMLENLEIFRDQLINNVHDKLMFMSMSERDFFWTTKINERFTSATCMEIIEDLYPIDSREIEVLLIIETWLLSSSYPYFRAFITRKLKQFLDMHSDKTEWLIEKFHEVDDPYILEGLYAAIYGVVVSKNETNLSHKVAEKLYEYHYGGEGKAPQDLMVRYWTLKIFELAYHQDSTIDVWKKAQPPYTPTEDIFAIMPNEDYESEGYFGETYGGKQIVYSLFEMDFSRYIIGTNSGNKSKVFFYKKKAVNLKKIEQAIAFLIKHRFGWNDDLGKYDADVDDSISLNNKIERIGKKYQWIGMYRVYAYLCDICQIRINPYSNNKQFAKYNYPWYAPNLSYFDPTLTETNTVLQKSQELFEVLTPKSTTRIPHKDWLEDGTMMPSLHFKIADYEEKEWILLHAYSTNRELDGEGRREQFVSYNSFFVAKKDYKKLIKWAKDNNFYGSSMPRDNGSIEYMWNEYPWADSYKQIESEDNIVFKKGGCDMTLTYSAQSQGFDGIPEEEQYLSTAYMPNKDMMETMNWHTAERGIICDEQDVIMGINRYLPNENEFLRALLVRRDKLDEYLQKKNLFLFWSLIGHKQYTPDNRNFETIHLTGAATYIPKKGVDMIQPLRNEPK